MHRSAHLTASLLLASAALSAHAQAADERSGVANPPEAMTAEPPAPKVVIPVLPPPATVTAASTSTDADIVVSPAAPVRSISSTPELKARPETLLIGSRPIESQSVDDMIVTALPASDNEIAAGTLVRVRFREGLSTTSTVEGQTILGEVTENLATNGRVLIPAGSTVMASVTAVRSGKRIHGAAMFHIEPRKVTLPDGTTYPLHATLVDSDTFNQTRVDSEGNLVRKDHAKETLAALSLTTGGAAAAGGAIAGVPGALIGAGVGAGVSAVWWLKQDHQLHVAKDSTMVFQMTSPTFLSSGPVNGAE